MEVLGIILSMYDSEQNNNLAVQLNSYIMNGSSNPGTSWIILGVILILFGISLIVVDLLKKKNKTNII